MIYKKDYLEGEYLLKEEDEEYIKKFNVYLKKQEYQFSPSS